MPRRCYQLRQLRFISHSLTFTATATLFHSFIPAISIPPLQVLYSPGLQPGYCIGVSRRSAQATPGKGLAQGSYVTARAGVEPTTLRLKVIDSTKAPSRPTSSGGMVKNSVLFGRPQFHVAL